MVIHLPQIELQFQQRLIPSPLVVEEPLEQQELDQVVQVVQLLMVVVVKELIQVLIQL